MKTITLLTFICTSLWLISCSVKAPEEIPETIQEIHLEDTTSLVSETTESDPVESEIGEEIAEVETPKYLEIQEDGDNLTFITKLADNSAYTRYQISYTSEWFTISGIMNIPKWEGSFPLVIFNHGYIDPAVYTLWRGLKREQDYFARNGLAVLHTDYRNHAFSDDDVSLSWGEGILRSKKYWADAINAILSVQKAKENGIQEVQSIDTENIWMLGHSMGGWVTMYSLVSQPDLINAAVLYAPVHSNEYYNFQRWTKARFSSTEIDSLHALYGNTENSESFASISPETYFENITAPIQMYFGTNDESCPIAWGYEIEKALTDIGKEIDFIVYDWEKHEFGPQWQNFMQSSVTFFKTHLKN